MFWMADELTEGESPILWRPISRDVGVAMAEGVGAPVPARPAKAGERCRRGCCESDRVAIATINRPQSTPGKSGLSFGRLIAGELNQVGGGRRSAASFRRRPESCLARAGSGAIHLGRSVQDHAMPPLPNSVAVDQHVTLSPRTDDRSGKWRGALLSPGFMISLRDAREKRAGREFRFASFGG